MRTAYKIILVISMILTGLIFWHESVYDKPPIPYTMAETIIEVSIMGPLSTAFFFFFIGGIYYACTNIPILKKKSNN